MDASTEKTAEKAPSLRADDGSEKHGRPATPSEKTVVAGESSNEAAKSVDEPPAEDESQYPTGMKMTLIITSLCLSIFLVALDQTIIAPALGAITAEFGSVKDIVSLDDTSPDFHVLLTVSVGLV
jgi:hypothetical protein